MTTTKEDDFLEAIPFPLQGERVIVTTQAGRQKSGIVKEPFRNGFFGILLDEDAHKGSDAVKAFLRREIRSSTNFSSL